MDKTHSAQTEHKEQAVSRVLISDLVGQYINGRLWTVLKEERFTFLVT